MYTLIDFPRNFTDRKAIVQRYTKRSYWVNFPGHYKAGETTTVGRMMHWPNIATPAGIRQAFPLHQKSKYLSWGC